MTADDRSTALLKSTGSTPTERYLEALCERNFLSLWSFPRPFRDQGGNKELCDLLMVMGDDVIIFSDKHCRLALDGDPSVSWQRWFRSAVWAGANQAWGAERWLRQFPERVFLDPDCRYRLPSDIPNPTRARFHLVVTVHGISAACENRFGGTGSMIWNGAVVGRDAHKAPFVIGDLDPQRTFIHVLDDASLEILMNTLDTAADLLHYLREKERLLRGDHLVVATGEENLLAHYLMHVDVDGEHILRVDHKIEARSQVAIFDETWWATYLASPQRARKVKADQVSYLWDRLIERFSTHVVSGTSMKATEPTIRSAETLLRFMAGESRLRRRTLASVLRQAVAETLPGQRRLKLVLPQQPGQPLYVFLVFPDSINLSESENRAVREEFLLACLYVARSRHRDANDVVGIATETGMDVKERSEDVLYLDARAWNSDDDALAARYQREFKILVADRMYAEHVVEYPTADEPARRPRIVPPNPRNKPCPCGSGRKYKFCHGAR